MPLRKKSPWSPAGYRNDRGTSGRLTILNIDWSTKALAYSIKFMDTYHWNEMQPLMAFMKSVPYGEYTYDGDNKIWYLVEKHIEKLLELARMLSTAFEVKFTEKQTQGIRNTEEAVPAAVLMDRFYNLTGLDIKSLEYSEAKKIYHRAVMIHHPDKGGNAGVMSEINVLWTNLEKQHFCTRKEAEYVT